MGMNISNMLEIANNGLRKVSQADFGVKPSVPITNPIKHSVLSFSANINKAGVSLRTQMTPKEVKMYNEITAAFAQENDPSGISTNQKLNELLRNGKLLDSNSNNHSTTLENLYNILTTPRFDNIDSQVIFKQTLNMIYKPSVGTQRFGDIPKEVEDVILKSNNIKNSKHLISIWEAAVLFYIGEGRFLCSAVSGLLGP